MYSSLRTTGVDDFVFLPIKTKKIDVFPCPRKENNNVFVDDLKEGEKRPIPNPCRTFLETYQSYPEIMENIERVGFTKPTPIQVRVSITRDHWVESLNTDE